MVCVLGRGNRAEWPGQEDLDSMPGSPIILARLLLWVKEKGFNNELVISARLEFYSQIKVLWYCGFLGKLKLNFLKMKLNM